MQLTSLCMNADDMPTGMCVTAYAWQLFLTTATWRGYTGSEVHLLEDCPHEVLCEFHDHILISKCHLQVHLCEAGLPVSPCILWQDMPQGRFTARASIANPHSNLCYYGIAQAMLLLPSRTRKGCNSEHYSCEEADKRQVSAVGANKSTNMHKSSHC